MRRKVLLIISILGFAPFSAEAQTSKSPFKIVGYYSLKAAMADVKSAPFKRVTHVNLYFLNPDSLGNFSHDLSALSPFINKAHHRKVKILFSVGGGGKHPYYHHLLEEEQRTQLIDNLIEEVLLYGVDGVDVDLEGSDIDENYEAFVVELGKALKLHDKLMTSAIAVYYKDQLSDNALAQYDFVNIMSYDRTGPWRPDSPGPHSTYAHATEDLEYFGTVRKIPKEKMTLGVPFYGYGFGPELTSPAASMNFDKIVSTFRGSESVDQWNMPDGKTIYYNGIPTMKQKTALAKEKASGIMIWQLRGDAHGSKSLLKTINKAAK